MSRMGAGIYILCILHGRMLYHLAPLPIRDIFSFAYAQLKTLRANGDEYFFFIIQGFLHSR